MKGEYKEYILKLMIKTTLDEGNGKMSMIQSIRNSLLTLGNKHGQMRFSFTWSLYILSLMKELTELSIHWENRYVLLDKSSPSQLKPLSFDFLKELRSLKKININEEFEHQFLGCIEFLQPSVKTIEVHKVVQSYFTVADVQYGTIKDRLAKERPDIKLKFKYC
jgi:hypothetical protein